MENIGKLFDGISNNYDRFNHLSSMGIDRRWRRQAVETLPQCSNILDVATGTADYAIEAVLRAKADHVTGIDISDGMLALGRKKVARRGMEGRIELLHADVAELPFEDESFDAVTCGYGVRNFAKLQQSLAEMLRVLKPGGQLRILEFTYPTNPVVKWGYNLYFTHVMPIIGRSLTHDKEAFNYFMHSVKSFPKREAFVEILIQAGFGEATYRSQTFGISSLYTASKI